MKPRKHFWLVTIPVLAMAAVVCSPNESTAAEQSAIDPTGTWKVTKINPETKSKVSEKTLKLKLDGDKLSGTITGRSSINGKVRIFEWGIKYSKLQGSDITFTVTHAPVTGSGPDSTTTYEGKLTGDSMSGKMETEWNGHTFKSEWEAKRRKE